MTYEFRFFRIDSHLTQDNRIFPFTTYFICIYRSEKIFTKICSIRKIKNITILLIVFLRKLSVKYNKKALGTFA